MSEVAELITFLASDKANFITGDSIKIDGGRACGRRAVDRRTCRGCHKTTGSPSLAPAAQLQRLDLGGRVLGGRLAIVAGVVRRRLAPRAPHPHRRCRT